MTDFVHEQLNKLNNTLLDLFENSQNLNSLDLSSLTADPIQALEEDGNLDLFLTLASRDIDLTNTPNIELVQKYLSLYSSTLYQKSNNDDTTSSLNWLFIAKCTVAVYGYLLRNILNSTLPLSESIQYWNGIYGSKRYEAYYALQSKYYNNYDSLLLFLKIHYKHIFSVTYSYWLLGCKHSKKNAYNPTWFKKHI